MTAYRWIWSAVATSATGLGIVLALSRSLRDCLLLAVVFGLCAGVLSSNFRADDEGSPDRRYWRAVGSDAATVTALVVAVYGLGATMGTGVVSLLVAMALTAPPVVAKAHHWLSGAAADPPRPPVEPTPERDDRAARQVPLEELSNEALCHEWCRTSLQLLATRDPAATAVIAEGRARLLEELGRRDPAALTSWLKSGARPFSDPRRFLTTSGDEQP